ncbi:rhomboid family intramembrane serine protease [Spirochaeta africana]|uniref:Putative membrane protein n=1 Tax=Spirochaeta africana (strain ATCC 700263 / DSM 8902 / Z-7692) TaxID=889378 RepID=H9UK36_SPIAZ|nr:rhomboid family intramembrane serine protease [Spirochaeta africana]AFG37879.1 putative membrane protein [Spirochaeta africana DSM 8902]
MKIRYNAPVTLTFSLTAAAVLLLNYTLLPGITWNLFTVHASMSATNPADYLRLFTHVIGHSSWSHLLGNLALLLLIGPILEEKYGGTALGIMIGLTAVITGGVNVLFMPTALLGASGVVFMMILLVSFTNIRSGEIPLTFILVLVLYLAREFYGIFQDDNISRLAHILGGLCGSLFGFLSPAPRE